MTWLPPIGAGRVDCGVGNGVAPATLQEVVKDGVEGLRDALVQQHPHAADAPERVTRPASSFAPAIPAGVADG